METNRPSSWTGDIRTREEFLRLVHPSGGCTRRRNSSRVRMSPVHDDGRFVSIVVRKTGRGGCVVAPFVRRDYVVRPSPADGDHRRWSPRVERAVRDRVWTSGRTGDDGGRMAEELA